MPYKGQNYINDLTLFALYSKGEKVCFEDLAKLCFKSFPQVFGLKNCSEMSDTRKLGSSLRRLRRKGLIKGDPKARFSLTKKGESSAKEVISLLKQQKLL